jgi:pyruvate ferredoxin oxidoreductase delta subunit
MTKKPDLKVWTDIPVGGVVESGTAEHFHTGGWRSKVPVWQKQNCIQCMTCWAFCPDNAIKVVDGAKGKERGEFDYDFCKGCGICPEECPQNNKIVKELKAKDANLKVSPSTATGTAGFDEKAAILFVGLKVAKDKFNIK